MIEAVIFDMDGLMIDSEPLWHEAEIEGFARHGIHITKADCLQGQGMRIDTIVSQWLAQKGENGISAEALTNEIVQNVIALVKQRGAALPGVCHALDFFRARGVTLALASSSYMSLIETTLERLGVGDYFTVIHSAQFEPYGKPHPGVFITTAQKLAVSPRTCLVLEDSINGIVAAKAAEMKCLTIPDSSLHGDKRLGIADVVLTSLEAIDEAVWQQVNR